MKYVKKFLIIGLILLVFASACIAETPSAGDTGNDAANSAEDTSGDTAGDTTDAGAAETPTLTPSPAPTDSGGGSEPSGPTVDDCPKTTGTLVSFIHPGHGYCFLVPSGFSASMSENNAFFAGKPWGELEYLSATAAVIVEPANGRTTADFAAQKAAESGALDSPQPITFGGQEAMIVTQIPARFASINVMLVHNDLAYMIVVSPLEYNVAPSMDPESDALEFWSQMQGSFVFFTPQAAATPQANLENCTLDAEFVSDLTVPDGTQAQSGAYLMKRWLLRNNGTCDWGVNFEFFQTNTNSTSLLAQLPVSALPMAAPGAEVEVSVVLTVADNASIGDHTASFALRTGDGQTFGATPYALVRVAAKEAGGCPEVPANYYWYQHRDVGVCFYYADGSYIVDVVDLSTITVTYIPPNQCSGCDLVSYRLTIIKVGSVGSTSLQDFADQQIAKHDTSIVAPELSNLNIAGNPAIQAKKLDLPGRFPTREAYVIANGIGYTVRLYPDEITDSNVLWDAIVLGSLYFFK